MDKLRFFVLSFCVLFLGYGLYQFFIKYSSSSYEDSKDRQLDLKRVDEDEKVSKTEGVSNFKIPVVQDKKDIPLIKEENKINKKQKSLNVFVGSVIGTDDIEGVKKARQKSCVNMRHLITGMVVFNQKTGKETRFPETIRTMFEGDSPIYDSSTLEILYSPLIRKYDGQTVETIVFQNSYIYVPENFHGLNSQNEIDRGEPILFERLTEHGAHVGFSDTSVKWFSNKDYPEKWLKYQNR